VPSTSQMTQNSTSHSHATSPAQVGGAPRPGRGWVGRLGRLCGGVGQCDGGTTCAGRLCAWGFCPAWMSPDLVGGAPGSGSARLAKTAWSSGRVFRVGVGGYCRLLDMCGCVLTAMGTAGVKRGQGGQGWCMPVGARCAGGRLEAHAGQQGLERPENELCCTVLQGLAANRGRAGAIEGRGRVKAGGCALICGRSGG
jgi:hypothetical protein